MARIRTIKPEFFFHDELYSLEEETGLPVRLAFIALWTQCDREGRFKWRPKMLKASCLPFDDVDFSRVLHALTTRGFVVKYTVNGNDYGYVPTFTAHQFINAREYESEIPSPELADTSTRDSRVPDACPTGEPRVPISINIGRGRGRDSGKEEEGKEETRVGDASSPRQASKAECQEVMDAWNKVATEESFHKAIELTEARLTHIRKRLKNPNWKWREALEHIRGSPFCHGENDRGWVADFDWFLRPDTLTKIFEKKYDGSRNAGMPF